MGSKKVQKPGKLAEPTAKDFVRMNRIMTRVREYVLIGLSSGNLKGRNDAIEEGNDVKFHYMQGAMDACLDIRNILDDMQLVIFEETAKDSPKDPAIG